MKHLLSALVIVGALFVTSNLASAQCYQTAYYAPAQYTTYYAPAPYATYYAAPTAYYSPAIRPYYNYRPWWGGYRYNYSYRPVVYYYGW